MDPCLSLHSNPAGVGLHSCTCEAYTVKEASCEPTHHFDHVGDSSLRINKRESKALKKQAGQIIEENRCRKHLAEEVETSCVGDQGTSAKEKSLRMNNHKRKRECNPISISNFGGSNSNYSSSFKSDECCQISEAQLSLSNENLSTKSSNKGLKARKLSDSENFVAFEIGMMKKISKKSNSSCSASTSYKDTFDHSSLLAKAYSLCEILNGRLMSTQAISGRGGTDGLSFECCNKHQFIISLSTLHKLSSISIQNPVCYDIWCLKCRNFFRNIQKKARSMNSTIVSSCLKQGFIAVKCENNHQFNVPYTRNYSKTWCEQCKNESIQKQKERYLKLEEIETKRKQDEQKRIFEESQKYTQQQRLKESQMFQHDESERFNHILNQVCAYAKQKMESYMSRESFKGNLTSVEVFNVYKIMYMPSEALVRTLGMVDRDQLQSYYRKLALIVHPDKNKHEQASDAFKKLTQAYEVYKH